MRTAAQTWTTRRSKCSRYGQPVVQIRTHKCLGGTKIPFEIASRAMGDFDRKFEPGSKSGKL